MGKPQAQGDGLKGYYKSKIEELELHIKDKSHNLRRLEAQRNELNTQGVCSWVHGCLLRAYCIQLLLRLLLHARSEATAGGAAIAAGAWLICGRSHQGAWHDVDDLQHRRVVCSMACCSLHFGAVCWSITHCSQLQMPLSFCEHTSSTWWQRHELAERSHSYCSPRS